MVEAVPLQQGVATKQARGYTHDTFIKKRILEDGCSVAGSRYGVGVGAGRDVAAGGRTRERSASPQ